MARIPRLLLQGESATYHVISRSALPGFSMGDVEKDFLLSLLRRLSRVYFAEMLGFCLMGSHAHVVVRMHTGEGVHHGRGDGPPRRWTEWCRRTLGG